MRFDRLRYRSHGRNKYGRMSNAWNPVAPEGIPLGETFNMEGKTGFAHEICCDVVDSHYNAFGVEQMHDLWLDKISIPEPARLNFEYNDVGTVTIDGEIEETTFSLSAQGYDLLLNRTSLDRSGLATQIADLPQTLVGQVQGWDIADPGILRFDPEQPEPMAPILTHMDLSALFSPFTTLLSRANPLRPAVNAPGALWETVKDLPGLIFNRGLTILKTAGNLNLQFQFGWKPLLADLKKLIDYEATLAKRLKTLATLRASQTVTNKVSLEKFKDTETRELVLNLGVGYFGGGVDLVFDVVVETEMERWGCVQYSSPELANPGVLSKLTAAEEKWEAIRTLYGLYWKNPSALWEIMPWSWMVDWLLPIQDLLDGYSNLIKLTVEQGAIMTRSTSSFTATLREVQSFGGSNITVDFDSAAFKILRTTKERLIIQDPDHLPTSIHGQPTLDIRKWGILISLFLQRKG